MRSNDAFRPFLEQYKPSKYAQHRCRGRSAASQGVSVAVLRFQQQQQHPEVVQQSNAPRPLKSSSLPFAPPSGSAFKIKPKSYCFKKGWKLCQKIRLDALIIFLIE